VSTVREKKEEKGKSPCLCVPEKKKKKKKKKRKGRREGEMKNSLLSYFPIVYKTEGGRGGKKEKKRERGKGIPRFYFVASFI